MGEDQRRISARRRPDFGAEPLDAISFSDRGPARKSSPAFHWHSNAREYSVGRSSRRCRRSLYSIPGFPLTEPHHLKTRSSDAPTTFEQSGEFLDGSLKGRLNRNMHRRWPFALALVVLAGCVLFSLWPALFAPIAADDRYWMLDTPARFQGSYSDVITGTWDDTPAFLTRGRLAPLGRLARRLLGLAVFDLAHLTSSSFVAFQGLSKLLLLAAGVAGCLAFAKVLRWRSADGELVAAGRASLTVIGIATSGLIAAGVQAHSQFRNGWISYPSLTYTTIAIVFGSAAIAVVTARRIANEKRGAVALGLLVAIGLAIILNWFYELNYVGLPLSLFALFAFPLTFALA